MGSRDTVSAIGSTAGGVLPHTTTGMSDVCFFRHALALDECRVKFIPEYAHGSTTLPTQRITNPPQTKEVWFVGSHSDMYVSIMDSLNSV